MGFDIGEEYFVKRKKKNIINMFKGMWYLLDLRYLKEWNIFDIKYFEWVFFNI